MPPVVKEVATGGISLFIGGMIAIGVFDCTIGVVDCIIEVADCIIKAFDYTTVQVLHLFTGCEIGVYVQRHRCAFVRPSFLPSAAIGMLGRRKCFVRINLIEGGRDDGSRIVLSKRNIP